MRKYIFKSLIESQSNFNLINLSTLNIVIIELWIIQYNIFNYNNNKCTTWHGIHTSIVNYIGKV